MRQHRKIWYRELDGRSPGGEDVVFCRLRFLSIECDFSSTVNEMFQVGDSQNVKLLTLVLSSITVIWLRLVCYVRQWMVQSIWLRLVSCVRQWMVQLPRAFCDFGQQTDPLRMLRRECWNRHTRQTESQHATCFCLRTHPN